MNNTESAHIQTEIEKINIRNLKVEADKAWETSTTRKFSICIITYITAAIILWIIGVKDYYLGAFVPVAGFILSTLSLPALKRRWIKKYYKTTQNK